MIAVVLAAGISSRLRPLTNTTPKSLLPVGGTPLLERTLRSLESAGLRECVIVTGYFNTLVDDFVRGLGLTMRVTSVLNPVFSSTNNNYSLAMAGPLVRGREMLMMDADILFDPRLLRVLMDSPHADALLMRHSDHLGMEEIKVELGGDGRIVKIGKDILPALAAGESIGIEKFSAATAAKLFDVLEKRKHRNEFYEASFQELIDGGSAVYPVSTGNYACMEIDTPDDLTAADNLARASLP